MGLNDILISFVKGGYSVVSKYGYIGLFFVCLIGSSSIIPIPFQIIVFSFGAVLNPLLVGIVAAVGSSLGNLISYLIGLGGKEILEDKYSKQLSDIKKKLKKYGIFLWLIVIYATPIPNMPFAVLSGVVRYDFKKFFLAVLIGELILNVIVAFAGFYSMKWVTNYLTGWI
jgi:membrane protein YqaA with SNARE-associated domain